MKSGSTGETITDQVLAANRITSSIEYAGERFAELPTGTVIMIHKGSYPVALVRIVTRIPDEEIQEPSFGVDYKVEILSFFKDAESQFPELVNLRGTMPYQGTFARVDNDSATFSRINRWYSLVITNMIMQEYLSLLQYKHQIILQGPPGTGKTRLAKLIANDITKPKNLGSALTSINEFFQKFDSTSAEVQEKRSSRINLLEDFQNKFPKEQLINLTPEAYAIGKGTNDSFCWWIERGLKPLGYYTPGNARSYLIYWSREKAEYSINGLLLKSIADPVDATRVLAEVISKCVESKDPKEAARYMGNSFLLKLLHSYYPSEYMPINSEECLNNALKLFGADYSNLDVFEKNLKLQQLYRQKVEEFNSQPTNNEFVDFLFSHFNMKGDIVIKTNALITQGSYQIIQFHPAYSYEDFVRGIVAKVDESGKVLYETENRILAQLAEKALNNPTANFVLIIDEINRANLPAVLGELIYALEYRSEENVPSEPTVEGMYALKSGTLDEQESKSIKLPKNLYLIGTMNTADRSVGHMDYAIRRRFAFVDILPSAEILDDVIADETLRIIAKNLYARVSSLFESDYLASDFHRNQVQLGHSYFLAEALPKLRLRLQYEIKPILREYIKDGILLNTATEIVEQLHV